MRPPRWGAPTLLASLLVPLLLAGCGEPSARVLAAGEGRVSFELPAEFTDLEADSGLASAYGLPSSVASDLNNDPVLYVITMEDGHGTSYQSLRSLVTGGQYDPLDPSMAEVASAAGTSVVGYEEISDPEVWGIRMRLAIGRGASDFQALVHRRSGEVVVTQLICTQACFVEHLDLIDQIQGSWSLET